MGYCSFAVGVPSSEFEECEPSSGKLAWIIIVGAVVGDRLGFMVVGYCVGADTGVVVGVCVGNVEGL